jgi:RNA-directed DNA polymerase
MKTYKNLYPQIYDFENLYQAYRKARRGKRKREQVYRFEFDLESNLLRLQGELANESYAPGEYTHFYVTTPKRRKISAAPFRDRVIHHALHRVIEPLFERHFIHDSYACRPGKGTHRALDRAQAFARRYPYVLQCDLEKFFPSVDHVILQCLLARVIGDARCLRLCDRILASGAGVLAAEYNMRWFPGDDLLAALRPRGLPIGNLTSQFWANVYLNPLDHFVKRELRCRAYLRYCDDFLLFAGDKKMLHCWKDEIISFLTTLRLTMHPRKSVVYPVGNGIPFLGFRLYPAHRRLKRVNLVAFRRRFRRLRRAYQRGEIPLERLTRSVQGWLAHAAHGNTWQLRQTTLARLPVG